MTIKAKFAGKCAKCGGAISVGDTIDWQKGQGSTQAMTTGPAPGALPRRAPPRSWWRFLTNPSGVGYRKGRASEMENAEKCVYCQSDVPVEAVPAPYDLAPWQRLAEIHAAGCEWVRTRAHTISAECGSVGGQGGPSGWDGTCICALPRGHQLPHGCGHPAHYCWASPADRAAYDGLDPAEA